MSSRGVAVVKYYQESSSTAPLTTLYRYCPAQDIIAQGVSKGAHLLRTRARALRAFTTTRAGIHGALG